MDQNRFWVLAAKKLSGDANKEELLELDTILLEYPEAAGLLENAKKAWLTSPTPLREDFSNTYLLQKIKLILEPAIGSWKPNGSILTSRKRLFVFLSSMVIIAVAAFLVFDWSGKRHGQVKGLSLQDNTVSAQKGSRTTVSLPDGSTVLLNADSRIYYSNNFAKDRRLRLEGEGYFEVVKDEKNPFIIQTAEMEIKVLGTVFNVRSYPDESVAEACLIKGSIEVRLSDRTDQPIILKPNEKISVASATSAETNVTNETQGKSGGRRPEPLITINKIEPDIKDNVIREIAWTQNKLSFQSENLGNVVLMLERWFGKRVVVENEQLRKLRYTGNFENETLEEILQALQLSAWFSYRVEKESVIIY